MCGVKTGKKQQVCRTEGKKRVTAALGWSELAIRWNLLADWGTCCIPFRAPDWFAGFGCLLELLLGADDESIQASVEKLASDAANRGRRRHRKRGHVVAHPSVATEE
jgi:hypothetical protein